VSITDTIKYRINYYTINKDKIIETIYYTCHSLQNQHSDQSRDSTSGGRGLSFNNLNKENIISDLNIQKKNIDLNIKKMNRRTDYHLLDTPYNYHLIDTNTIETSSKEHKALLNTIKTSSKIKILDLTKKYDVDYYTNLFKHLPKYMCINHSFTDVEKRMNGDESIILTGEITYTEQPRTELKHAFTIHSTQGITVKNPNKLFIDVNRIFDYQQLYTAISRVEYLDQIIIIK
jgi:ATP-dependent exoDNAse (exonuclease V) alpha subunit